MIKVLFMIHDLGQGGAEKVLVNLVNNMDRTKFDISVIALFGGGVNEQFLNKDIHYKAIFKKMIPANTKLMKLFTPELLHKLFVKEKYDIEISYLEGPSARIISGSPNKDTKLVSWIHVEQHNMDCLAKSFRSHQEAKESYNRFDQTICVSQFVKNDFTAILDYKRPVDVLYNTVESDKILTMAKDVQERIIKDETIRLVAVGTLKESKGYMRLLRIVDTLVKEHYPIHLYILGIGPLEEEMKKYIGDNQLNDYVTLLGYETNPYKYVKACNLLVCASFAEGFSTAVTEALILGVPVCTVNVSGMKELLGEYDEYGIVVENNENALYQGIKKLLDDESLLNYYAEKATQRGKFFDKDNTVHAVESMLIKLVSEDK